MKTVFKLLLTAIATAGPAAAEPAVAPRRLPFPEERATLETLFRGLSAAGRFGDRVIGLKYGKAQALVTPFTRGGATREAVFGKIEDGDRREIFKGTPDGIDWRSIDVVGNKALLFDGQGMAFVEADPETLGEVARRSVPWDMVRPPQDRGGEATAWETRAFRARFATSVQKTLGVKVVGLTRIPDGWRGKKARGANLSAKERGYFAITRLPGFPLLELVCSEGEENPSACVVARACNVSGLGDVKREDLVGAAAIERGGERLIVTADASRKELIAFRYTSCFHVVRAGAAWVLPARLKELTNFSVDQEGALWVTTAEPDDYLNASLYTWPAGEW